MRRPETVLLAVLLCAMHAREAFAVGTPAGTRITNRAQVTYSIAGTTGSAASNALSFSVGEILDVNVTLQSADVTVVAGETLRTLRFRVTNQGNGPETLALSFDNLVAGDDFDPVAAVPALYFDTDDSGDLSAADATYQPGINDPALAPDAGVNMLLVNDMPAGILDGAIGRSRLVATSTTGRGQPGTTFPGQGVDGTDAVVGANGGMGEATGQYIVGDVTVSLAKSVSVVDPAGVTSPVPGAGLTYQILVTVSGSGTARALGIDDAIPANTAYVPGSLRLNGAVLTDAADADAGEFVAGSSRVHVLLGDLTGSSGPQTVSFTVIIP